MSDMVLEGIRVADWTIAHAGPKGTFWLAAMGAEVIHIERPGEGDDVRNRYVGGALGVPARFRTETGIERPVPFEIANFNKKSMTVNLSQEKGKDIVYRLVKTSDVFATNQLPDTIEKLGMDYDTLVKYNPQLIYVTNNIMGYKGPYRLTPGYDTLGMAVSGIMATSGVRGQPPMPATWGIGDLTSAFAMYAGVVTALLYRQRTGKGQRVDTSQMQALINIPVNAALAVCSMLGEEERQANPYHGVVRANPRENAEDPASNYYQCKDGKWVCCLAGGREKYFPNLAKGIGRPELIEDPRFADVVRRRENNKELIRIFEEIFAQRTAREWLEQFKGLDIPFYLVNDLPDLLEDPQVIANDMLWTFEYPDLGVIRVPGMPFNLSESPGKITAPAPELGQHTEEVLLALGYSWDEILQFREQKIV